MGVRLTIREYAYTPVVTCDWCGKDVHDDGIVEFLSNTEGVVVDERLWFVHQKCTICFEESHGGHSKWRHMNINVFIRNMIAVTNFSLSETPKRRKKRISNETQ